jgi:hypothetical protein
VQGNLTKFKREIGTKEKGQGRQEMVDRRIGSKERKKERKKV